jgi:hypothetical protein
MGFLSKLFHNEKPENVTGCAEITKVLCPEIDYVTREIFKNYLETLIHRSPSYIVAAAWGSEQEGPLDQNQKEMFRLITPMVDNVVVLFDNGKLTEDQKFAMGYIIRDLIISKVNYMVESFKNRAMHSMDERRKLMEMLYNMETSGNA